MGSTGETLEALFSWLEAASLPPLLAVGHRLVHGGPSHFAPERLTPALLQSLKEVVRFAPLHLPAELAVVDAVERRFPGLPQVCCFDTGFHRDLPEVARRFAVPDALHERGLWRYGFHGLSYESAVAALSRDLPRRMVVAHLGGGASLAAIHEGRCIDTTMGLSPTGGVMMGTRSGDLDPGLLLHLLRSEGYDAASLGRLIDMESGLLGVSGISADMRTLLELRGKSPRADLAVEMFCYQVSKAIGSFAVALGGLDALVFTGGIGEHAAPVREAVCARLGALGIRLDPGANASGVGEISAKDSEVRVRVVPADEEAVVARHTFHLLTP
jgi:acetate kinase